MNRTEAAAVLLEIQRRASLRSPARYLPHTPTARQAAFLALTEREAFYGGAAGGGKSDALLYGALQYAHLPGYAALLLRRKYTMLTMEGGLIPRSHEWLGGGKTDARWNGEKYTWYFPSGATLKFGHVQHEADKYEYQGGEFSYIGFDELTQFLETQYLYIQSRLRRTVDKAFPLRVRSAGNPGGIGHEWVHRRFIKPGAPDRPFIPARLDDNPHLDQAAYLESLSVLDSVTLAQLRDGLWIRQQGGLIYPYGPQNLIPAMPALTGLLYGLGIDLGASKTKETMALVVVAWHPQLHGMWVVQSETHAGMIPSRLAARIETLRAEFDFTTIVMDEGALGAGYGEEFRKRYAIGVTAAQKNEKRAHRRLLKGELEQGTVQIVEGENAVLLEEIGALEWDDDGLDSAPGLEDHVSDALLYAWRATKSYAHEPPDPSRLRPEHPEYDAMIATELEERARAKARKRASGRWWET